MAAYGTRSSILISYNYTNIYFKHPGASSQYLLRKTNLHPSPFHSLMNFVEFVFMDNM